MISGSCTCMANQGARTNRPHMPKMIEGTPASSCTATPMGSARGLGQNSVRKTATPQASGRAMASESRAVTMVPTMGPAPP